MEEDAHLLLSPSLRLQGLKASRPVKDIASLRKPITLPPLLLLTVYPSPVMLPYLGLSQPTHRIWMQLPLSACRAICHRVLPVAVQLISSTQEAPIWKV